MIKFRTRITAWLIVPSLLFVLSCTRNQIEFGTVPENSYTRLIYIDTVGVQLSTVITDSFSTGSAKSFLLGKYKDPYLGLVAATPFLQFSKPAEIPDIPETAVFDSLSFIAKLKHYYYGDTTAVHTVYINELAESIVLGYSSMLYNTSSTAIKPTPIGSSVIKTRPMTDDSIIVHLDEIKGRELFEKIRLKDGDITSEESFLNYFKGVSLTTGVNDTSLLYALTDSMIIRVHYHTTVPYPEAKHIDFVSQSNALAYNQVLTDRNGTGLVSLNKGVSEIPITATNDLAFSQPATGLYLKMTFPTLKGILQSEDIVRLLKAELVLRPVPQSFDNYKYKLPAKLSLYQTDGSNINNGNVLSPDGANVLSVAPVLDELYGEDNYYSFDITSYVNTMLNTGGTEDQGFFAIQALAGSTLETDRIIAGDAAKSGYKTQLKLSVLVINK